MFILSNGLKHRFIDRTNEQHIATKVITDKVLPISGIPSSHHRILADAYSLHRTQRLADLGLSFLIEQLDVLESFSMIIVWQS